MGSPGIFGERTPSALFIAARLQLEVERSSMGYRASFLVPGRRSHCQRSGRLRSWAKSLIDQCGRRGVPTDEAMRVAIREGSEVQEGLGHGLPWLPKSG